MALATASGYDPFSSVRRVISRIVEFGTAGYPEQVARRLRLVNGLNAVAFVGGVAFSVGYGIADWQTFYPIVITIAAVAVLLIATPFFHRVNEVAAIVYYCLINAAAFLFESYLVGSMGGSHFFLLAAPAAMLVLGAKRFGLALALSALLVISFMYIEFWFPERSAIVPVSSDVAFLNRVLCITGSSAFIFASIYYAVRIGERAEAALEREYDRSENLLLNLMPSSIAARLKDHPDDIIADQFDDVTILFADIVDFTPRSSRLSPGELVRFLNRVFSIFDDLAERYRLEKIKTIGDAYMVAGGMPELRTGHAQAVGDMALDMLAVTERLSREMGEQLAIRIGIHTGPAVAGVIGTRKLFYDVWGDTVNTASRMESHGSAGRIQVTEDAKAALGSGYSFEHRGVVDVKGKGEMTLYYLTARA